jgi:hypothetical protein
MVFYWSYRIFFDMLIFYANIIMATNVTSECMHYLLQTLQFFVDNFKTEYKNMLASDHNYTTSIPTNF